ncbi:hypothetical protein X798_01341 [Onchocerca flexuosa]|uniref:Uncharacterized protein n=2 Tax=Onchocerca flexuosa TaxID=387005 RepID=A0A183H867_9BILA|nr:hypothetical protein X798_01341 [Onchocerca flexuosa]VDO37400.1 unnamed protein product [Onchocerca flexuosa]
MHRRIRTHYQICIRIRTCNHICTCTCTCTCIRSPRQQPTRIAVRERFADWKERKVKVTPMTPMQTMRRSANIMRDFLNAISDDQGE